MLDVISGNVAGVAGPALNHQPVQGAIVTLEPGALPWITCSRPRHRAFAYVLAGEVTVAGRRLQEGSDRVV